MNTLFVNSSSWNTGSSRIWVYDLCEYMRQIGHRATVRPEPEAGSYDAVILGKGAFRPDVATAAKALNPGAIVGWINASIDPRENREAVRSRLGDIDFLIVGSIEERDSLLPYVDHVFIFPLVERLYTRTKTHTDHEPIVLGYHGNAVHLSELHPHAMAAIDLLSKEIRLRMIAVHTPRPGWQWTIGRPNIDVEQVPWRIETVEEQLLRCDVGIVPGITPVSDAERDVVLRMLELTGPSDPPSGYDTDYLLRFKNKSNAGRSFVFHQLGIPVVAAFMPSHFHILGNPDCGFLAHSTEGWLDALRTLARSAETRTRMAEAATAELRRQYDPLQWAGRLCRAIAALAGSG